MTSDTEASSSYIRCEGCSDRPVPIIVGTRMTTRYCCSACWHASSNQYEMEGHTEGCDQRLAGRRWVLSEWKARDYFSAR